MGVLKEFSRKLRIPYSRWYGFKRLAEYHSKKRSLGEVIQWAMGFGGSGYYKVVTLQLPYEITSLAKAVKALQPKRILEIGTARGGTTLIWSYLASEKVVSCDMRDLSVQGDLFRSFAPPGSSCTTTLLTGDSHDPAFRAQVERELGGEQVDFLFIDGDHTEAGVEADYRDYKHLVRPGGIIAFHDIVKDQPLETNQVYPFWQRLKQEGVVTEEFVCDEDQCGFGIGIVRV